MKEYKIQYKELNTNDDRWWDLIGFPYSSLEDTKKAIEVQKSYDKDFLGNTDWEYKILVRDVNEWKELQEL